MKRFYENYKDKKFLSAVLTEISWTNNLIILRKSKSTQEQEFYLKLVLKEKYSSRELERQMDSGLFERVLMSNNVKPEKKFDSSPSIKELFRDNYILDFLELPKSYSENDLRKGIMMNLKEFVLEFGKDFSFVGEEYRIEVGNKDFYIDLLFYHRSLRCLVALDLKITDFKPEYLGKMEFYLEALDRDVKKDFEKPSVGIVLCKSKDERIVEYAMSRSVSSTMVSQYKTELLDKKILERKLDEFFNLAKESSREKLKDHFNQ